MSLKIGLYMGGLFPKHCNRGVNFGCNGSQFCTVDRSSIPGSKPNTKHAIAARVQPTPKQLLYFNLPDYMN